MATASEAPTSVEGQTQHTQAASGLAKLREPFPKEQIHQLPKIWCTGCSRSHTKVCEDHRKAKCKACGNYITQAHIDLDYVGHAELTRRLLDADPLWTWEPLALDERGLPAFDENGGLWIRLTVCGHTRLGYGDSQGKRGPNAVKEAIGDALRNAAMRFGAALDLWSKSDLREAQSEHPKTAEDDGRSAPAGPARPERQQPTPPAGDGEQLSRLMQQVASCWNNKLALEQIRLEGKKLGLSGHQVQGPPPEHAWTTFDVLLGGRIKELEAAQGGDTGRSAA